MDVQIVKLEIIKKLLDTTQEDVLTEVWNILEESRNAENILSENEYKIMDERRERHRTGESPSFSWDEVKQQARRAAAE